MDELNILIKKTNEFKEYYNNCKNKNYVNELDIKEKLYDILGMHEVCLKHVDKGSLTEEELGIISGIKYANNLKKHSESIFSYNLNTYNNYPSSNTFPSVVTKPSVFGIWWNELPLDNGKASKRYRMYNQYIKNHKVSTILYDVLDIIKKHIIPEPSLNIK